MIDRVLATRILWRILCTPGKRVVIDLQWNAHDWWVGLYYRPSINTQGRRCVAAYVCLLPCLPVRISLVLWQTRRTWEQIAEDEDDGL